MILSAYHINRTGKLCFSGLPTQRNDITILHHNGVKPYKADNYSYVVRWSYPVTGIIIMGDDLVLVHGWIKKEDVYPIDPYNRPDLRG